MSANPVASQLVAYYEALLPAQYITKPKAVGTIGALAGGSDGMHGLLANAIYTQVRQGFDLQTAVGQQLDFLGELIGPARNVSSVDILRTSVALPSYDDPDIPSYAGLSTYELDQPPSWYTMTYEDFNINSLTDGDYRRVLMFLAQLQASNYSYAALDALCYDFFAGNVNLKVTGSMDITYQHLTSDADDLFEIINQMGLLPQPAGVAVSVQEVANF